MSPAEPNRFSRRARTGGHASINAVKRLVDARQRCRYPLILHRDAIAWLEDAASGPATPRAVDAPASADKESAVPEGCRRAFRLPERDP